MHSENIMHRDIKAENIMIESLQSERDLNIKLTDFGFACFFKEGEGKSELLGSPLYMAPEIVRNQEQYDSKVDIWSTGVITYILLSGKAPFRGKFREGIFQAILN
jgi:serine/threonine protein kinase